MSSAPDMSDALETSYALETIDLAKSFGGIKATNQVSLRIKKGARHALIGPNGAGKTTVINLLSGATRPTAGRILLDGQDITVDLFSAHIFNAGDSLVHG